MRNDSARLAKLREFLLLDSSPERAFDDITRLLATSFDVPIAMVNVLDAERDWFKSSVGLRCTESPATTSLCESFFRTTDDVIVVADTTLDRRFVSHPRVVGPPFVRFYAAARLAIDGHTFGTLCAYDLQPRNVSTEQLRQLQTLATAAVELIRQRRVAAGAA